MGSRKLKIISKKNENIQKKIKEKSNNGKKKEKYIPLFETIEKKRGIFRKAHQKKYS